MKHFILSFQNNDYLCVRNKTILAMTIELLNNLIIDLLSNKYDQK